MDWTKFFETYGQSLFTLGGVLLGSLITFWINAQNLKYQSRERDKDRQEQRREAKTQLALELKRNDIRALQESIDNHLEGIAELRRIRMKYPDDADYEITNRV